MTVRTAVLFVAVLLLAVAVRRHTLVFPHDHGDQLIYPALADNLLRGRAYALTCVATTATLTSANGAVLIGFRGTTQMSNSLAGAFAAGGLDIYHEPLYFHAPGFPALIAALTKLQGEPCIRLLSIPPMRAVRDRARFFRQWARSVPARAKFRLAWAQLPSALPPLAASLVIVLGTMLWARPRTGLEFLWAGLIMALSPVDIFASQRVLADSAMTAGIVLSLLCLRAAMERHNRSLFVAALLAGIAATCMKESAAVILAGASVLVAAWSHPRRAYLLYAVLTAMALVPWLLVLHHYTGRWIPVPPTPQLPATAYRLLTAQRTFFRHIWEVPYLSPVLTAGVVWLAYMLRAARTRVTIGTAVVLAVVGLAASKSFEHRYLLAAYPFMACAAAWALERLRVQLNRRFQPVAGVALVVSVIAVCAAWGLALASPSITGNAGDIFLVP